jgi:hypothetical protein
MFLEEFTLDAAGVFPPPPVAAQDAPALPAPGSLLGAGASLFLGSDLFPARILRKRRHLDRAPLSVLWGERPALYTGESLDQFDMDVFLGCVRKALRRERPVRRSQRDFLRMMGRKPSTATARRLEASLLRLASARIELTDRRFGCCVQLMESVLVDRELGVFRAQASPEALAALGGVEGLERLARLRFTCTGGPLFKWLAGLILVLGNEACLMSLPRLRALCGFEGSDMKIFAARVLPVLRNLMDMGYIHCVSQCPDGRVMIHAKEGVRRAAECSLVW